MSVREVHEETWEAGEVIAERYRLEVLLGTGGMGQVWRAEHLLLRSPIALKLVRPSVTGGVEVCTRLLREARAAAALRSPHVVQILDYGLHEGAIPYIAMEFLEGQCLAERLEHVGALPLDQVCRIVTHTARAMSRAHEADIVHRDIKPENIFLVANDDEEIAKVLDFGIAKITKRLSHGISETTRVGQLLGSPNYMSPEQIEGDRPVDYRTDLWSLAVIAFECVTGKMAFESTTLGDLMRSICRDPIPIPSRVRKVPPGFDAWFARAAARNPADRFQSARELAERLRDVLAPGPPQSRRVPAVTPRSPAPTPFSGLVAMTGAKGSGTFARGSAPDAEKAPSQSGTVLREDANPESPPPKKVAPSG